jgi:hypothetical protein
MLEFRAHPPVVMFVGDRPDSLITSPIGCPVRGWIAAGQRRRIGAPAAEFFELNAGHEAGRRKQQPKHHHQNQRLPRHSLVPSGVFRTPLSASFALDYSV